MSIKTNLPEYEKVALINEYQENSRVLEDQISEAKVALKRKKKLLQHKLEQDRDRLATQIRKEKDAIVTKHELDRYRGQEQKRFHQTVSALQKELEKFFKSADFEGYLKHFYTRHQNEIKSVVAPQYLLGFFEGKETQAHKEKIMFEGDYVAYDFSPAVLTPYLVKKFLVR